MQLVEDFNRARLTSPEKKEFFQGTSFVLKQNSFLSLQMKPPKLHEAIPQNKYLSVNIHILVSLENPINTSG